MLVKRSIALLFGLALAAVAFVPALADGNGAQKGTLVPATNNGPGFTNDCKNNMTNGVADHGFAVINLAGQPGQPGKLIIETSLKSATPGANYTIYLSNADGSNCQQLPNSINTNVEGNGNAHNVGPNGPTSPGTYYVYLTNSAGSSSDAFESTPMAMVN